YQPFMIDTSGRGSYTRSDKGYVAATLDRAVSGAFAWQARGSWLRSHFTDYNPDDWSVSDRLGAELRGILHAAGGDDRVVTFGLEAAQANVASDIFGDHSEVALGPYGQAEQRVGRLRLTAGLRLDDIAVDGAGTATVLSPRIGAALRSGVGTWRASVGRGFRAPTLAERYVTTRALGFEVIPNPALDPETAWSFELGNGAPVASWGRLDAALFWTEASDLLEPTFVLDAGVQKIQIQNISRARIRGLDASLTTASLVRGLTSSVAYLFLDARDLATDSVLSFRPKHMVTLGADYQWRTFSVGAEFRYTSRIERIELEPVFGGDPRVSAQGHPPPRAPCPSIPPSSSASRSRPTSETGFPADCIGAITASPTEAKWKRGRCVVPAAGSSGSSSRNPPGRGHAPRRGSSGTRCVSAPPSCPTPTAWS